MKHIKLKSFERTSTRDIINMIMRVAPPKAGIDYETMRCRIKVMDAVEACAEDAEKLSLEDADYSVLSKAMREFQFGLADKDLFEILEDIVNAEGEPSGKKDRPERPNRGPRAVGE